MLTDRFLSGKVTLDGEHTEGLVDVWEAVHGPQEVSHGHTFSALEDKLTKRVSAAAWLHRLSLSISLSESNG